jgi:hypothetical protein
VIPPIVLVFPTREIVFIGVNQILLPNLLPLCFFGGLLWAFFFSSFWMVTQGQFLEYLLQYFRGQVSVDVLCILQHWDQSPLVAAVVIQQFSQLYILPCCSPHFEIADAMENTVDARNAFCRNRRAYIP